MKKFHSDITSPNRTINDFALLVSESDKANIVSEAGFYSWGTNIIKHSDGLYYSIIEKWPDTDGLGGWVHYIGTYVSDGSVSPLGPFTNYEKLVELNNQAWSGNVAFNPNIHYYNGLYYLFYTGSYYSVISYPATNSESRANQRIGVATATHPKGPYTPEATNPILIPRPTKWDRNITTNPSVWKDINGLYRMAYKSDNDGVLADLRLGVATSSDLITWSGRTDTSNFGNQAIYTWALEDAYVWKENDKWYCVVVDWGANILPQGQGLLLISNDGISFYLPENYTAWNKTIYWTDLTNDTYTQEERPFVLVEDNKGIVFTTICVGGANNSFNIARTIDFK